jgi:hypothetical protein
MIGYTKTLRLMLKKNACRNILMIFPRGMLDLSRVLRSVPLRGCRQDANAPLVLLWPNDQRFPFHGTSPFRKNWSPQSESNG